MLRRDVAVPQLSRRDKRAIERAFQTRRDADRAIGRRRSALAALRCCIDYPAQLRRIDTHALEHRFDDGVVGQFVKQMLRVDFSAAELRGALGRAHQHFLRAIAQIAFQADAFRARRPFCRCIRRGRDGLFRHAAHEQRLERRERALMTRQLRVVEVAYIQDVPAAIAQHRKTHGRRTRAAYIAHVGHCRVPV